jgi:hypothetical protein
VTVRRFDASPLANVERLPSGAVRIPAFLTRVGVFAYRMGDGSTRRELRPASEVFSVDSLRTLRGVVVTDLHPPGGVRADNWKDQAIGHVCDDVKPEGLRVAATLHVQDAPAIARIDAGERAELSCGYTCDIRDESGVTADGESYDVVQHTIRYNHVGIGPRNWGRAGSSVALRLDSADGVLFDDGQREGMQVMKIKIDGKEYEVGSAECAKALADQEARAKKADSLEAAAKKRDRADLVALVGMIPTKTGKRIDEEGAAIEKASDDDLKILICEAVMGDMFDPSNTDPAYVAGCFASAAKKLQSMGPLTGDPAPELDTNTAPPPAGNGLPPGPYDSKDAIRSDSMRRPRLVPKDAKKDQRVDNHEDGEGITSAEARRRMIGTANTLHLRSVGGSKD